MDKRGSFDDWLPLVTVTIILSIVLMIFFVNANAKAQQDKEIADKIFYDVEVNMNLINLLNYKDGKMLDLLYVGVSNNQWDAFNSFLRDFFEEKNYDVDYQIQIFKAGKRILMNPNKDAPRKYLGEIRLPDITSSGYIDVKLFKLDLSSGPTGGIM